MGKANTLKDSLQFWVRPLLVFRAGLYGVE
jgi:hypothetical protein